jgi:ketosteroid isomerase-like protein
MKLSDVVKFFEDAVNRGDVESLAKIYSGDAWLLPPNFEIVIGRDAIKDFFTARMSAGKFEMQINIIQVDEYQSHAIEISKWVMTSVDSAGNKKEDSGKSMVIWKKDND